MNLSLVLMGSGLVGSVHWIPLGDVLASYSFALVRLRAAEQ